MKGCPRRANMVATFCFCLLFTSVMRMGPCGQAVLAREPAEQGAAGQASGGQGHEIVLASAALSAETVPVFSLDQLVKIALERNPAVDVSRQSAVASTSKRKQAMSYYLPQLTAQAGFARYWMDMASWAAQFGSTFPPDENVPTATVTLNQYVYDFGKTDGRYCRDKHLQKAEEKALMQTTDDVVLATHAAYYAVLKAQRFVTVQAESADIYGKHLKQARDFLNAGMRPPIDVTKAEVGFSNAQRLLTKAQYASRLSHIIMENVLGGPPVSCPYKLADVPDPDPQDIKIEGLIEQAMSQRPEIAAMQEQVLAAGGQVKSAWGGYLPSVSAQAQFDWIDAPIAFYNTAYILGVNLNWDVFSGLRTREEVAEARSVRDRLKAQLRQRELGVVREVNEAIIRVNENVDDIRTTTVILQEAKENLALAEARYGNGLGDYLEFSDAELTWRRAENDLIQARYDYLQSLAELDHALGGTKASPAETDK